MKLKKELIHTILYNNNNIYLYNENTVLMLKTLFTSFILFFIFQAAFSTCVIYSQEQTEIDSLTTGKKYRITLYDEKEVIGRVSRQDSVYAYIVTETATVRIKKEDIFSISSSTIPRIMKAMFSIGGGFLLITGQDHYYNKSPRPGYSLLLAGLMPINENKAVRLDLGYGHLKRDEYTNGGYPDYYFSEASQTRDIYLAHVNFLFGDFTTDAMFSVYGLGGAGIIYSKESDYMSTYYSSYDTTYHYDTHPGENITAFSIALGCGTRIKLGGRIGMFAEIQYNLNTSNGAFLFFGNGYFPVRAGFSYILY